MGVRENDGLFRAHLGGGRCALNITRLEARVKEGAGGPRRKNLLHHKRRKAGRNGSPFRAAERRSRGRPATKPGTAPQSGVVGAGSVESAAARTTPGRPRPGLGQLLSPTDVQEGGTLTGALKRWFLAFRRPLPENRFECGPLRNPKILFG